MIEVDVFVAGGGDPFDLPFLQVQDEEGWLGGDVVAGIEDPGILDAIDPGTAFLEGGLVDMTGKHHVGAELPNPIR